MRDSTAKWKRFALWVLASTMIILYILMSTQISYAEEDDTGIGINFVLPYTVSFSIDLIVDTSVIILNLIVDENITEDRYKGDSKEYNEDQSWCEHSNNFFTSWYCACRKQPI